MKELTIFRDGCKTLASVLVCTSSFFSFPALANVFDYSNTGIIKASSGSYYLVEGSNVSQITPDKAMQMQQRFPVNTTRGMQDISFVRQATPYLPKIGNAVSTLAQRVGPIGMATTAVSLICTLSNICNQSGVFTAGAVDPLPGSPDSYPLGNGDWWGSGSGASLKTYPTPELACGDTYRITTNCGSTSQFVFDHIVQIDATHYHCFCRRLSDGATFQASNTYQAAGCATGYTASGSNCNKTGLVQSHAATAQDWTNAEASLNDSRFVDELVAQKTEVPINLPTSLNFPQTQMISDVHDPIFDSSGTHTGTKRTLTQLVLNDASTTNNPNQLDVQEQTVTTYYDTTGNVVGTPTITTTEVNQRVTQPNPSQLCGLPGQDPCNVLIDERGVQTAIATLDPLGQTATNNVTAAFDTANNSILARSGGVGSGFQWPWQINAGSCSPLVMDSQKGLVFDLCPHIPLIQQILGYVFYVLTAIAIFNVFFQPKTT